MPIRQLLQRAGAALYLATSTAIAATIGGVTLPPTLHVGDRALELVSCGVRDTLWIDHYAAGLYVPTGQSATAAKDGRQTTAVLMKIIQARYLPEDIPSKWRHALAAELQREPMMRVRRAYDGLSNGDVVTFAYVPRQGTTMRVNGRLVLDVEGHLVIDAILDAWAEQDRVDDKLHRLALEHPC